MHQVHRHKEDTSFALSLIQLPKRSIQLPEFQGQHPRQVLPLQYRLMWDGVKIFTPVLYCGVETTWNSELNWYKKCYKTNWSYLISRMTSVHLCKTTDILPTLLCLHIFSSKNVLQDTVNTFNPSFQYLGLFLLHFKCKHFGPKGFKRAKYIHGRVRLQS